MSVPFVALPGAACLVRPFVVYNHHAISPQTIASPNQITAPLPFPRAPAPLIQAERIAPTIAASFNAA